MGTYTGHKQIGESVRAYIVRTEGFDRDNLKVVAHNRHGRVHYFALYNQRTNNTDGVVVLTSTRGSEVAIKLIDEAMGPCYYDASARVIGALSPTSDEYANSWRDRCRDQWIRRARLKRATVGDSVTIGQSVYRLVGKQGGAWIGRHGGSGLDYRIGRSAWSRASVVV